MYTCCSCYVVDDDNDCQLSITSLPDGGVALQHYDLPQPLKGIESNKLMILVIKHSGIARPFVMVGHTILTRFYL